LLRKEKIKYALKKFLCSIVITIFLAVLSSLPNIGFSGRTVNVAIEGWDQYGNLYVLANCEVTYNPLLYPLSWLFMGGSFSGKFYFISTPLYGASPFGEYSPHVYWPSRYELMQEALDSLVVHNLSVNIIVVFCIVLVIMAFKIYDLYLCIFLGALTFPIGGPCGVLAAFTLTLLAAVFVKLKLKGRGLLAELLRILGSY